jgi:uncharacterized protein
MKFQVSEGVALLNSVQWDAVAGKAHPFLSHAFLSALEMSGSVGPGTGWQALPISLLNEAGQIEAAMPAYAKSHSQGEYIFDHGWADAWQRAGGHYYPKLLIAVPFTPAAGPRLLARNPASGAALLAAAETVVAQNNLSSAHANFVEPAQLDIFRDADWLIREGVQYHWFNRDYASFDDFLNGLSSRKRKMIRKERAGAQAGLKIKALTGDEIKEEHWDAFWYFYQDTGARKWGQPYLTRAFFSIIGDVMRDKIVLMLAERDGHPIAGALNFIGREALYGRYWGCREEVPFLHFELCYYQAIDVAIRLGLSRVEAGAQGEHKIARGYEPTATWSAHYIADPGFRAAVGDFVVRERRAVEREIEFLGEMTPFKKSC